MKNSNLNMENNSDLVEILILGCGDAKGVPKLGCECRICQDALKRNSKNRRTRASIIFRFNKKNLLIDTSPDFREQMVENNIYSIDALLLTHSHADHILGFEDFFYFINFLNKRKKNYSFPIFGSEETLQDVKKRFFYLFKDKRLSFISLKLYKVSCSFHLFDCEITPIRVDHGDYRATVFGYLFNVNQKSILYIPDGIKIRKKDFKKLLKYSNRDSLDVLIIGMSRLKHSPNTYQSCFSLEQILKLRNILRPKQCFLTHLPHYIDYNLKLPSEIKMCFDKMKIRV
jgi:phosphoribosyl 1,2-cyclic phosphate phosphodiesterase